MIPNICTNYDYYKEMLTENRFSDTCHEFIIPYILNPTLGKTDMKCDMNCLQCRLIQSGWMNETYVEPEIDWSQVPIDTKIEVSTDGDYWIPRHFAGLMNNRVTAWDDGCTSYTQTSSSYWNHARLYSGVNANITKDKEDLKESKE